MSSYGGITPAPLPVPISTIEGRESGSALNQPFGCGTWVYLCVLGVVACCALVSGSGFVMSITCFLYWHSNKNMMYISGHEMTYAANCSFPRLTSINDGSSDRATLIGRES